jgi:signal transduction histidine kinase/CheY-like chemotaxis protein
MGLVPRLLAIVVIALLPGALLQALFQISLDRDRERDARAEIERLTVATNGELRQILEIAHTTLVAMTASEAVRALDRTACSDFVGRLDDAFVGDMLAVFDRTGSSVCRQSPSPVNVADRPWFKQALAGEFYLGEYQIGRTTGKRELPLAAPVKSDTGEVVGVAALAVDLEWLATTFAGRASVAGGTVLITDRNGTILVREPDNDKYVGTKLGLEYAWLLKEEHIGTVILTGIDGVRRVIGYVPPGIDPKGVYLGVGLDEKTLFHGVRMLSWIGWAVIASGSLTALVLALAGGIYTVDRPIRKLLGAVKRYAGGDREARAALVRGAPELRALGAEFDRMAGALKAREDNLQALNATLERRVETEVEQRMQAESALRQSQKMEAIGQLTGGIAHDFNNLLHVMLSSLELIKRHLSERPPRIDLGPLLDAALRNAERAVTLTRQLLAFSRRQPLSPRILDVNRLVSGMSQLLRRTLGEGIKLETVLAGGLWPVSADPNQLESAILNLAINARDAMPGGGKLTIETANTALDEDYARHHGDISAGQYAMIAVTDTGAGMAPDVVAKAFDPFFTTKGVGKGTGLGLSQVYGYIKQSGGHVKIYSEPGEGTTIRLYLPRTAEALADELGPALAEPQGGRGERILLVEDDEDVRAATVTMLKGLNYVVSEAATGEAALRLLEAEPEFDLLFTDVGLPGGLNGRQLADRARERRPALKLLFTTGYARNAIIHEGRLDPGVELLTKPFTSVTLAAKLRRVLGG